MSLRRMAPVLALAALIAGCGGPDTVKTSATADRPETLDLLRDGGYVIYIRHTATDGTQDDPTPDLADPETQRNLSKRGREQARRIGRVIKSREIPIGRVLTSPYNRTKETARLAFGRAERSRHLLNEIYPGTDVERRARMLRRLLRERPAEGANTVLVSHGFNLDRATGLSSAEGDTVIFDPDQPLEPVMRIGVDEWESLA